MLNGGTTWVWHARASVSYSTAAMAWGISHETAIQSQRNARTGLPPQEAARSAPYRNEAVDNEHSHHRTSRQRAPAGLARLPVCYFCSGIGGHPRLSKSYRWASWRDPRTRLGRNPGSSPGRVAASGDSWPTPCTSDRDPHPVVINTPHRLGRSRTPLCQHLGSRLMASIGSPLVAWRRMMFS